MTSYDDEIGWTRIDELLSSKRAGSIRHACEALLDELSGDLQSGDLRAGDRQHPDRQHADKPHGGTKRLVDLVERVPEVGSVVDDLAPVISQVLGPDHTLTEGTYRSPDPGYGQQLLHADDVPRMTIGPNLCATAIVPLVDFTAENGATRVVPGSNLRPDLQRQSGKMESHPDEIRLIGPVGVGFVFTGHLMHSGMRNDSALPRPALQLTFRVSHR